MYNYVYNYDHIDNHTDKKNVVLLKHWKYFGYMQIFKTNPFYKQVKKLLNIDRNFNIYYKKI